MTTPPEDPADTMIRLPLLPSPAEMALLRAQRAHIEEQLQTQTAHAVNGVAECAAALGLASERLTEAVQHARAAGASWAQIGAAVGISRQAAAERWTPRDVEHQGDDQ